MSLFVYVFLRIKVSYGIYLIVPKTVSSSMYLALAGKIVAIPKSASFAFQIPLSYLRKILRGLISLCMILFSNEIVKK